MGSAGAHAGDHPSHDLTTGHFFNKPVIILGLPLLFWLAIGALVAVIIVLNIAYRWGSTKCQSSQHGDLSS